MTFVHRFGSALNAHLRFNCCIVDGVFIAPEEEWIPFHAEFQTDTAIARVQYQTRRRVLKLFQRKDSLSESATAMMRRCEGGFLVRLEES